MVGLLRLTFGVQPVRGERCLFDWRVRPKYLTVDWRDRPVVLVRVNLVVRAYVCIYHCLGPPGQNRKDWLRCCFL